MPVTVQAHPAVVVIVTVVLPPLPGTLLKLVGLIVQLQTGAAAWFTVNDFVAIVKVDVRLEPLLASTVRVTVWFPLPVAGAAVIQAGRPDTLQPQLLVVVTDTCTLPPPTGAVYVDGAIANVHDVPAGA